MDSPKAEARWPGEWMKSWIFEGEWLYIRMRCIYSSNCSSNCSQKGVEEKYHHLNSKWWILCRVIRPTRGSKTHVAMAISCLNFWSWPGWMIDMLGQVKWGGINLFPECNDLIWPNTIIATSCVVTSKGIYKYTLVYSRLYLYCEFLAILIWSDMMLMLIFLTFFLADVVLFGKRHVFSIFVKRIVIISKMRM